MKFRPYEYQQTAIKWIIDNPRCGLFLDMGLGKTIITLNHINRLINEEFAVSKVLVICPKLVCHTWSDEIRKWELLLTYSIVLANPQQRRNAPPCRWRGLKLLLIRRSRTVYCSKYTYW